MRQLQAVFQRMQVQGSFASDATTLFLGNIISQGISVLSVLVLTRIYAPQAFGEAALVISLVTILGMVACGRFDQAILLPSDENDAAGLVVISLLVSSVVSLVSLAVVGVLWFTDSSGVVERYLLWFVPFGVFASGASLALSNWMLRQRRFGWLSIARSAGLLFTAIVQLALGWNGWATGGSLLLGFVGGLLCTPAMLCGMIVHQKMRVDTARSVHFDVRRLVGRYRKFPLVQTWGSLLDTGGVQLPVIFLTALFPATIVGYYTLAFRFVTLPIALIGSAISQVYFQRLSAARNRAERLDDLTRSVLWRLVLTGGTIYLVAFISGKWLFQVVFGQDWSEAGVYVQILAPSMFLQLIYASLSVVFVVLEVQFRLLFVQFVIFAAPMVSMVLVYVFFSNTARMAIIAFSSVNALVFLLLTWYEMRLVQS